MLYTNSTGLCPICLEELVPIHQIECTACRLVFHIRMTENEEARDCGSVWLDEDSEAMVFMCKTCQVENKVGPMGMPPYFV